MNVGMLVNNLAVSGGYQKLVLRLGRELRARGHAVTIYTLHLDRAHCYPGDTEGLDIEALPDAPGPTPAAWARLAELVSRDLDALVLHDESSLHALASLTGFKGRVVWMLNNELGLLGTPRSPAGLLRWTSPEAKERRALRRAARRVDAFAVYDERNAAAVKRFLRRDATVVFAGADIDDFERIAAARSPVRSPDAFRVVSVGVLFPHRRYEDLVDALALLETDVPAQLTIVGLHDLEPGYARTVRERVATLGLEDRVSFREYVEPDELAELYRNADAFAFVNDGHTWGIAAFEALAAGVPLVLSATAGAADLLTDGHHAWIVPPRDPQSIAAALSEIHRSPDEARRRVRAAHDEVLDVVRWPQFAGRIEGLLQ
jgi:glycosyltransferase involved in cell wall biosynthesis